MPYLWNDTITARPSKANFGVSTEQVVARTRNEPWEVPVLAPKPVIVDYELINPEGIKEGIRAILRAKDCVPISILVTQGLGRICFRQSGGTEDYYPIPTRLKPVMQK